METMKCKLPSCGNIFELTHGSKRYCSKKCYLKAKVVARNNKYGSTKIFREILAKNSSILKELYTKPEKELTVNVLMSKGFDFSLTRQMRHTNKKDLIILDAGAHYLETIDNNNYKIKSHEQ